MNFYLKTIFALSFIATLSHAAYETPQVQNTPVVRWSSAETMASGAFLGAAEGIACSLSDGVIFWPISWWIFSKMKTIIAQAIINDAHRNNETLDASLLLNTSRLASWISYLALLNPHTVHRMEIVYVCPIHYSDLI